MAAMFERALSAAERVGRSPREINLLRGVLTGLSVATDDGYYFKNAPAWLARLERDSGLDLYRESHAIEDDAARLKHAFEHAMERYAATPESERAYRPDEAIKGLVQYVAISIAIGARTLDAQLIAGLPSLLLPFTRLSPLVEAMWQNAIATFEVNCGAQQERAHARASYEARARVAVWAGEKSVAERFARLTAREYRHGRGSPLGARYERLVDEAQRAGVSMLPQLSDFASTVMATTTLGHRLSVAAAVQAMHGADGPAARAACALGLICDGSRCCVKAMPASGRATRQTWSAPSPTAWSRPATRRDRAWLHELVARSAAAQPSFDLTRATTESRSTICVSSSSGTLIL